MYRWKAYNQYDLIENLKRRGHDVDEIRGELQTFEKDEIFEQTFRKKLNEKNYDIVFTVNYFPVISDICQEKCIRYLSWCCDSPISTMYNDSVFNQVNTILTFDKIDQMTFAQMGAPVEYLPLCADVERVDTIVHSKKDMGSDADISFIGSMYNKNSYDEVYEHMTDYMKGYFDCALKIQANTYERYLLDDVLDGDMLVELSKYFKLQKSSRSFSDLSLIFSTTVLSYKIAQLERKKLLAGLSKKYDVHIYTDDEKVKFLNGINHGTADYWSEAPVIFNRSRVNLNLTLKSIRSGIPLRVWDIMAAGGFCMTNYQGELPLYFKDGEDIVWFKSEEELYDKMAFYLSNESKRAEIARAGYEKVKKYHTYMHRFDSISQIIPKI